MGGRKLSLWGAVSPRRSLNGNGLGAVLVLVAGELVASCRLERVKVWGKARQQV
jgi:hypothetical protein